MMDSLHIGRRYPRSTRLHTGMRRTVVTLFVVIASIWSVLAIYFSNLPGASLRIIVAVAFGVGTVAAFAFLPNRRRTTYGFFLAFAAIVVWWNLIPASHDREWLPQYAVLPHATISGNAVTVYGVRNFDYRSVDDFTVRYEDRTYRLDELSSVDFVLSYWGGNTDIAHFMLSFGFGGEDYLAVSMETRREVGEAWTSIGGFFKQFELIMILGDERDLLRLRTNFRQEEVYVYPTVLTPEEGRGILMNVLNRANRLYQNAEFYNTITHNCLTSLPREVHEYRKSKAFDIRLIKNGLSDQMAYENGLFATRLGFEETKRRRYINQYVEKDPESLDYSRRIRPGRYQE